MDLRETQLQSLLKRHFNQEQFSPGQRGLIEGVLSGRDVMATVDPASDPSICYRLPALILEGTTIFITNDRKISEDIRNPFLPAICINNATPPEELQRNLRELIQGKHKLLYISPDQFRSRIVLHTLNRIPIPLLVIEDAHCISRWGNNFRLDYLHINNFIMGMDSRPTIMLLAAPCPQKTKLDMLYQFQIVGENTPILSSDHSNLSIETISAFSYKEKLDIFEDIIQKMYGSGIIYVNSRQQTVEICDFLRNYDIEATPYHGGMGHDKRLEVESNFSSGKSNLIVTTNAGPLASGIIRQDIRYIIHFSMPNSPENYYKQICVAGRDGKAAQCILIYAPSDRDFHRRIIETSSINSGEIWRLRDFFESKKQDDLVVAPYGQIEAETGPIRYKLPYILREMEDAGMIAILPDCSTQAITRIKISRNKLPECAENDAGESVIRWLLESSKSDPDGHISIDFSRLKGLPYPHDILEESFLALYYSDVISYRPLRQGIALRIKDLDVSLNHDIFEKLKEYQYESLRMMEEYINDTGCRQQFLAHYLDFDLDAECGNCDNCLTPKKQTHEDDITISIPHYIRLTLELILKSQGKLSRNNIAEILIGKEQQTTRYDKWEEFGSLSMLSPKQILNILDSLIGHGFLKEETGPGAPVDIKNKGFRVLKGEPEADDPYSIANLLADIEQILASQLAMPDNGKPKTDDESPFSDTDQIFHIILQVAQKAQGQLGRSGMMKLLRGEKSKKLAKYDFDHFEEYGILRDMPKKDLLKYIDIMIERGCLSVSILFFPTLILTEAGQKRLSKYTQYVNC